MRLTRLSTHVIYIAKNDASVRELNLNQIKFTNSQPYLARLEITKTLTVDVNEGRQVYDLTAYVLDQKNCNSNENCLEYIDLDWLLLYGCRIFNIMRIDRYYDERRPKPHLVYIKIQGNERKYGKFQNKS